MDANTLLEAAELRAGMLGGLVAAALAATWVVARTGRDPARRSVGSTGVAGVAFAAGSFAAFEFGDHAVQVPSELWIGVVAVAVAGVASRCPWPGSVRHVTTGVVLSIPGAWIIAERSSILGPAWMRTVVLVGIVVVAQLVADFDRRHSTLGAGPVLLLVTAGGIYATVPDTEEALVLLGVAAPIALLGFVFPVAALGSGGAHAAVALLLWAAAYGAVGRPASLVGAIGTFGIFLTAGIGRVVPGRPLAALAERSRVVQLGALVAVQVLLALYAAQVVGAESDVAQGLVLLAPAVVVGLVAGWLLAPVARDTDRPVTP